LKVVLIFGSPGVGKSEVGRIVAERLGLRLIELAELAGGEEADMRAVSARAGSILRREGGVVVSHIPFKPRGLMPRRVIVLRRNPLELVEVLRSRGYSREKVRENVEAELIDYVYVRALEIYGPRRTVQIRTSGRTKEEVAERVLRALRGELRSEEVDWIGELEANGSLEGLLRLL
jgi:adenylate kinase